MGQLCEDICLRDESRNTSHVCALAPNMARRVHLLCQFVDVDMYCITIIHSL
jgi:hypothetical protein